jgi:hypothetical protein
VVVLLQANKASAEDIKVAVQELLSLKQKFKDVTGKEYALPAPAPQPPAKKKEPAVPPQPKEKKASTKAEPAPPTAPVDEKIDLSNLVLYTGSANPEQTLSCLLAAEVAKKPLAVAQQAPQAVASRIPYYPALVVPSIASSSGHTCKAGTVIFGTAAVCRYLALDSGLPTNEFEDGYLDLLEGLLSPSCSDSAGTRMFLPGLMWTIFRVEGM